MKALLLYLAGLAGAVWFVVYAAGQYIDAALVLTTALEALA